ncbi:hypothetical protein Srubr_36750 [Streptomyces rubradiris]|uniref:Uncharacterized protein n=1 Tax=Streptomyces rubradiris TaxID=285531 RepID=A0ABQ3RDB2_STRRR|nr:hypothetical protein GCM10018792_05670 [Streptomyces rubradiris]GHI53829.1 hypothetical protein Srubr_36750 [Streptomyces rubradiris]
MGLRPALRLPSTPEEVKPGFDYLLELQQPAAPTEPGDRLNSIAKHLMTHQNERQMSVKVSPVTPIAHIMRTHRNRRSAALFDGIQNHHTLHMMRHRKDVGLRESGKVPSQSSLS